VSNTGPTRRSQYAARLSRLHARGPARGIPHPLDTSCDRPASPKWELPDWAFPWPYLANSFRPPKELIEIPRGKPVRKNGLRGRLGATPRSVNWYIFRRFRGDRPKSPPSYIHFSISGNGTRLAEKGLRTKTLPSSVWGRNRADVTVDGDIQRFSHSKIRSRPGR